MSSKVHTEFTSDGKQLMKTLQDSQREIEKLTAENRKLAAATKKAHEEAVDGSDDAGDALEDLLPKITAVAAGAAAIGAAWKLANADFEDYRKNVEKLKDTKVNFQESVVADLRRTGQLDQANKVEDKLRIPGTTPEQAHGLFSGVYSSGPITVERALELAIASSDIARTGETPDKLHEFGTVLGEIGDLAPGKSAGDVADITAKLQELTRGDFSKFGGPGALRSLGKLTQGGMTVEEALGWGAAGMDANVEPETLARAAAAAQAAGMSFEEAIANPKRAKLGGEVESSLALINGDVARQRAEEFRVAQQEDAVSRGVRHLTSSEAGTMVALRQHGEATFAQGTAGLNADATIEDIIAKIDPAIAPHKLWSDRTLSAMEARSYVRGGDLPATAAIRAYGGSQSPEYEAAHSKEENEAWDKIIELLKNLEKLQKQQLEQAKKEKQQPTTVVGGNPEAGR